MPIPGVTPFAGTLPVENEPATFPARAETLFTWLTANAAPEIDAVADGINTALNDNGTVLDTAGKAIALTTNAGTLVPTSGTGNAYTITPAVAISAYENGQTFQIRANRQNAGAVTLSVGGLGPIPVRKVNQDGVTFSELVAGDFRVGEVHVVGYNGGQFELLSTPLSAFERRDLNQVITGTRTFEGATTFSVPVEVRDASNARLELFRTGDATTHQGLWLAREANTFVMKVRNSADVLVQTPYVMTIGANGATQHGWSVHNSFSATVEPLKVVADGSGEVHTFNVEPQVTGTYSLGASDARYVTAWLVSSPNVSSDARLKSDIADLTDAERAAAAKMKARTFRMKDTGQKKVGYIAQEIIEAMQSEGLCAFEYGLVSDGETYGVDMDAINAFRLG